MDGHINVVVTDVPAGLYMSFTGQPAAMFHMTCEVPDIIFLFAAVNPFDQERLKFIRRKGPRKIVPLYDIAAHHLQGKHLLFRLHTFRNGGNPEHFRYLEYDLKHARIPALTESIADELHIQLQSVDRKPRNHVEGRIPGSEVIHLDRESHIPQLLYFLYDPVSIFRVGGFRDLKREVAETESVLRDQFLQAVHHIVIHHIHSGYVDGNGYRKTESLLPAVQLGSRLRPHKTVQFADQTVILKEGNEYTRINET